MPSSSWWTCSARFACCRALSRASPLRSMQRQPRTIRSTWAAVPARPTPRSRASVSGVATRVRARTLAYDSSPRASASARHGSVPRARATRTRSRAARRSSPTRQLSQAAQERKPVFQPPRASKSRMRSRRRAVAASRCADSSAIASPSRSSSAMGFEIGGMLGEWTCMPNPPCSGRLYTRVSEPPQRVQEGRFPNERWFFVRACPAARRGACARRWDGARRARPTLGDTARPRPSRGKCRRPPAQRIIALRPSGFASRTPTALPSTKRRWSANPCRW